MSATTIARPDAAIAGAAATDAGVVEPLGLAPVAIRILPAPRTEPPHDAELLALGLDAPLLAAPLLPLDLPTGARVRRSRRESLAGSPLPGEGRGEGTATDGSVAVPNPGSPQARLATRRFVATCVEILGGFRPLAQLRPMCVAESFDLITRRLLDRPAMLRRAGFGPLPSRRTATTAARDARQHLTGPVDRVAIRRVQVCDVSEGVAEIAAVLSRSNLVWALAARLELIRGRWLCTHLELV